MSKHNQINIRVTAEQFKLFKERADGERQSLSAWALARMLEESSPRALTEPKPKGRPKRPAAGFDSSSYDRLPQGVTAAHDPYCKCGICQAAMP